MRGLRVVAGLLFGGLCLHASAQIYSCTDAKGRRLTADRPIAECLDREQRVLSTTGTVQRKIGPVLTAQERAAEDERVRKENEERNRLAEEKKRDRALLTRYPLKAPHDQERAAALAVADEAIAVARKNIAQLVAERKKMDIQLEFFKADPSKVPPRLAREIEENQLHMEVQQRFIANQEAEKKRINERFDDELAKLRPLWAARRPSATAAAGAASVAEAVRRPASSSAAR